MAQLIPPQRLGDNLWFLGNYHLCVYLVRGQERSALFEVGFSLTAPLVLAQLDALKVPREEVAWVILSHAHGDHSAGANGLLAGLPQARLALTPEAGGQLKRANVLERFSGHDAFASPEVARREGLEARHDWPALTPPPEDRLRLVSAGQSLDLGGPALELLSAQGHVPGGLTAWLPDSGALLASDSAGFYQNGGCGFPLHFVSYGQYQDHLAELAALGPGVLGLGHQGALAGAEARAYLSDTAAHLRDYQQQACRRYEGGQSIERISAWLFDTFYRDELAINLPENIAYCCDILVKRSLQHEGLLP